MESNDKKKDFLANINRQSKESFKEEEFIYHKKDHRKWIVWIAVIVIGVISTYLFLNQKTEVIDFTQMSYQDVAAWASDKDVIITIDNEYSDEVEVDNVITQSIQPGEKVKKDTNIIITVSEGLDPFGKIAVPDFDSTWTRASISQWLEQNGIENFTIINQENTEIEENYLISYRLIGAAKEDFMRSSEIEFTISDTEDADPITIPSFLGGSLVQVDIWAKNNGISYSYDYEYSSIYNQDTIMSQSVEANEEIESGSTVSFVISRGERPERVSIPSFSNTTVEEAKNYSQDSGISVQVIEIYRAGTNAGDFISQSIKAGNSVEQGTSITVRYSLGDTIIIPKYINELKADFQNWVKEINELGANITLTIYKEYNSDIEYGRIISQNIYNESVGLSTNIEIIVSLGESYTVIDFSSLGTKDAIKAYADAEGISVVFEEIADSGLESGSFISQELTVGKVISKKDFIKIQIAQ